jgi:hypothetical protein
MSTPSRPPEAVTFLHYPADLDALADLRCRRLPRLLLLAHGAAPPEDPADPLEDWVRLPADPVEVDVRAGLLAARAAAAAAASEVSVDDDGLVRRGGRRAALTPAEAAVFRVLLAAEGSVVRPAALEQAAAELGSKMRLTTRMTRLRARLVPLDLELHAVRGRGYLLELLPPP